MKITKFQPKLSQLPKSANDIIITNLRLRYANRLKRGEKVSGRVTVRLKFAFDKVRVARSVPRSN